MKIFRFVFLSSILLFAFADLSFSQTAAKPATGKAPVIVIPGITGSTLYNKKTNKEVWFKLSRPKDDDIRLPIGPDLLKNSDNLEPRDIIRGVRIASFLPEIEIYERLIHSLEQNGYREVTWELPGENGHLDTFYVFPYDWRRDNVENARLLIRRIEKLKAELRKPDLKFNIVAHSMGGLIARYAAMYGDADIPAGDPVATWAGAKHMDKIFMLGTPNDGSVLALRANLGGASVMSFVSIPAIQNFTRYDAFTSPSLLQLLPSNEGLMIYDENFKRLPVDIYDVNTWDEYDWSVWEDPGFESEFTKAEQKLAKPYFTAALNRAKRFQQALRSSNGAKIPVSFYVIGGDCKETINAAVMLWDDRRDRWETIIRPKAFTRSDGTRVTEAEVKGRLSDKGDGTVTLKSLVIDSVPQEEREKFMPLSGGLFQCEDHTKLVQNSDIQTKLFGLLKQ
jgi:pimeloyl-ACP methyl ester carboxylesterase